MLRHRRVLALGTSAYLGFVCWVTLGPQPLDERGAGILQRILDVLAQNPVTAWVGYDAVEFGANVGMFVPLGLLFLLLTGQVGWWLALSAGVATTCTIEFIQFFLPERYSDPRDILANSLGTLLGVLVGVLVVARRGRLEE